MRVVWYVGPKCNAVHRLPVPTSMELLVGRPPGAQVPTLPLISFNFDESLSACSPEWLYDTEPDAATMCSQHWFDELLLSPEVVLSMKASLEAGSTAAERATTVEAARVDRRHCSILVRAFNVCKASSTFSKKPLL